MSAVQAYQGQGSRRHPASRESRSCMPTGSSTSTSPGTPLPPSPSRTSRPRVSSPQYRLPDPGADRELARTARLPGARAHGHAGRQRRHPPRTRDASSRPARRRAAPAPPQEGSPRRRSRARRRANRRRQARPPRARRRPRPRRAQRRLGYRFSAGLQLDSRCVRDRRRRLPRAIPRRRGVVTRPVRRTSSRWQPRRDRAPARLEWPRDIDSLCVSPASYGALAAAVDAPTSAR